MRWFLQRVELLRERNRLEAIVRAQSYEIERLRAERERTNELLRWALTEGHEEFGAFNGEDVPGHWCAFDYAPDRGACSLHEKWVDVADACGLLAEMAEDACGREAVGE